MNRRIAIGTAPLVLLAAAALAAPWLGLPDPNAQPDGLVLRDLPPGAVGHAFALADGDEVWVTTWERLPDGGVRYRRGEHSAVLGAERLAGGSPESALRTRHFPLGTDAYGRDLLSRLVWGGRISLFVGLLGAALALAAGASVGLAAGLSRGRVDALLMRGTDVVLAIPRLFLALLIVALHGASLGTTVAVLGATTWMAAARLTRAEVLSLRERGFVQAARASGAGPWRRAWRHVFPGAAVPLLVEGALRMGDTILLEASLSFLGFGVPPPTPSWGNLVADGKDRLADAWWIATLPGIAVALTVIALNLVADGVRERLGGGRASLLGDGGGTA